MGMDASASSIRKSRITAVVNTNGTPYSVWIVHCFPSQSRILVLVQRVETPKRGFLFQLQSSKLGTYDPVLLVLCSVLQVVTSTEYFGQMLDNLYLHSTDACYLSNITTAEPGGNRHSLRCCHYRNVCTFLLLRAQGADIEGLCHGAHRNSLRAQR